MSDKKSTVDPATVEEIESVPGLRTALEVLGEANMKVKEDGLCVMEFRENDDGTLTIQEITDHVAALEGDE